MVKKIEKAKKTLTVFVNSFIMLIAVFKYKLYELIIPGFTHDTPTPFIDILLFLSFVAIITGVEFISEAKIDRFRLFRKLIMGREDIEGTWIDIHRKDGAINSCAFIHISYYDGEYIVQGHDFSNGEYRLRFKSTSSKYKHGKLEYEYKTTINNDQSKMFGKAAYNLTNSELPVLYDTFDGYFCDYHSNSVHTLTGVRLRAKIKFISDNELSSVRKEIIGFYKASPFMRALKQLRYPKPEITTQEMKTITTLVTRRIIQEYQMH